MSLFDKMQQLDKAIAVNQEPIKSPVALVMDAAKDAVNFAQRNHESPGSFFGAQMGAMGREAVKDIRDTIHETFFGKGEHGSEPGAPMQPTPQLVTAGLTGENVMSDMHGIGGQLTLDQMKGYAKDNAMEQQHEHSHGMER